MHSHGRAARLNTLALHSFGSRPDQSGALFGGTCLWGLDWEIHPTLDKHPQAGSIILRNEGFPEHWIRAILSHADHTNIRQI